MVGKIMKHELHALFRKLVILYAIVILFAVLLRIVAAVNVPALDGDTYFGLIVVLVMFYSYSLIAACVAATVLGISRFFKTMFTGEGYLTLALPATPAQLIWAKLLSALIASFSSIIVCLLSACIFYIGLDASIGAVFSDIFATLDAYFATDPLLATELIVLLISVIPMSMLEFYLIASVGQCLRQVVQPVQCEISNETECSYVFICLFLLRRGSRSKVNPHGDVGALSRLGFDFHFIGIALHIGQPHSGPKAQ